MKRALLIILFTALPVLAQTPASDATSTTARFTGTWMTTITPPVEAGAPPFRLLITFFNDRNLIATGVGGELAALGNPCQGKWSKSGDGAVDVTYICFDFDAALQTTGMDKLVGALALDPNGNTLTGSLALTNYDPAGHEVFSACCASVEGTRVEVEKLH
jgi:hypothetical protein